MSDLVTTHRPGQWVSAGAGGSWLLADMDPSDGTVLSAWSLMRQDASLDTIVDALLVHGLRSVPSFALLRLADDGAAAVVVRGAASIVVTRAGEEHAIGAHDLATWREAVIPAGWSQLRLSGGEVGGEEAPLSLGVGLASAVVLSDPSAVLAPPVPEPHVHEHDDHDLPGHDHAHGVLLPSVGPSPDWGWDAEPGSDQAPEPSLELPPVAPASALTDAHEPYRPQLDKTDEPEREPLSTQAMDPSDLPQPLQAPPEEAPASAPMVDTVRCEQGHLNPLTVGVCRVCGIALQSQVPQRQPRPQLGVLRLSTGAVIPLDRDVVLGRNPSSEAAGVPADSHLVSLESPNHDMSRTHAAIHLDGWVALLADLNSTNGTTITLPWQEPVRLRPNEPVAIEPGTIVNLANEVTFRYEPIG